MISITLHNKKQNNESLSKLNCCVQGKVILLKDVNDEILSMGILGNGYGVIPENSEIFAPCACTVKDITNNGSAVLLKSEDGLNIIIHFGINLSKLSISAVELNIKSGQQLAIGDRIGEISLGVISDAGLDPTVCVIITNSDDLATLNVLTGIKKSNQTALEYSI